VSQTAIVELKGLQAALRKVQRACTQIEKKFAESDHTALTDLEKAAKGLESALLAIRSRAQLPETESYNAGLIQTLAQLRAHRGDVNRRREDLAATARAAGWPTEHTGAKDYIGPFSLQHQPADSVINFGSYRLQKIKMPSGQELVAALEMHRKRLESEAMKGWSEFFEAALAVQNRLSVSEPVPWPRLASELVPDPKARRKAGKTLLFRLSMLLSGRAPGDRGIQIVPPTLFEQRSALTVPKLNQANDEVRVYRVRLS
jgi:hypothetical protein